MRDRADHGPQATGRRVHRPPCRAARADCRARPHAPPDLEQPPRAGVRRRDPALARVCQRGAVAAVAGARVACVRRARGPARAPVSANRSREERGALVRARSQSARRPLGRHRTRRDGLPRRPLLRERPRFVRPRLAVRVDEHGEDGRRRDHAGRVAASRRARSTRFARARPASRNFGRCSTSARTWPCSPTSRPSDAPGPWRPGRRPHRRASRAPSAWRCPFWPRPPPASARWPTASASASPCCCSGSAASRSFSGCGAAVSSTPFTRSRRPSAIWRSCCRCSSASSGSRSPRRA